MNVLLAGAAGFLGSHLSDRLISEGHTVIGIDNLSTGSFENISHLSDEPSFIFIESEIENISHSFEQLDLIVNMASPASPKYFEKIPLEIASANSNGTLKLLELAKEYSARFLFASTSECYGDPEVNPQPETYNGNVNPVSIRGVYDESKRFGESLTAIFQRIYGIDARIARIFNTYGPRMLFDDGRAVPNFVFQALSGKKLTVYGDGSQTRSFCYVSDMINGLMSLIDHMQNTEINKPVNLGNPQEVSILNLAKMVLKLTKSESTLVFKEKPEQDPCVRCPDISKAIDMLQWKPIINLEEGLLRTIQSFKESGTISFG